MESEKWETDTKENKKTKNENKNKKTDLYPYKHKPKLQCVIYRVGKAAGVEFEKKDEQVIY